MRFIGGDEFFIEVDSSPYFKKYFKHKGDREYVVIVKKQLTDSWAFLYIVDDKKYEYSWNEFGVVVPLCDGEYQYSPDDY